MSKISTGTGDDGTTGLVGGERVKKTSQRIGAVGVLDEVNDTLGVVTSLTARPELVEALRAIQEDIFTIGADLASPVSDKGMRLPATCVARLEAMEDKLEAELPPLTKFILPGGTQSAAFLQLARSQARRAEREAWRLQEQDGDVNPEVLRYLNRLSDLLFLLAREDNQLASREEPQWVGRG